MSENKAQERRDYVAGNIHNKRERDGRARDMSQPRFFTLASD